MDGMDGGLHRRQFEAFEELRKRLYGFRRPLLDIVLDKCVYELVSPLGILGIHSGGLERAQGWEVPELREGREAIEFGMIEFPVEPLHLAAAM